MRDYTLSELKIMCKVQRKKQSCAGCHIKDFCFKTFKNTGIIPETFVFDEDPDEGLKNFEADFLKSLNRKITIAPDGKITINQKNAIFLPLAIDDLVYIFIEKNVSLKTVINISIDISKDAAEPFFEFVAASPTGEKFVFNESDIDNIVFTDPKIVKEKLRELSK